MEDKRRNKPKKTEASKKPKRNQRKINKKGKLVAWIFVLLGLFPFCRTSSANSRTAAPQKTSETTSTQL